MVARINEIIPGTVHTYHSTCLKRRSLVMLVVVIGCCFN